jgi:hypothetical protein
LQIVDKDSKNMLSVVLLSEILRSGTGTRGREVEPFALQDGSIATRSEPSARFGKRKQARAVIEALPALSQEGEHSTGFSIYDFLAGKYGDSSDTDSSIT